MPSKAFLKIMAGLQDAAAHSAGDTTRGRVARAKVVTKRQEIDVAALRKRLHLSQTTFATGFGVSLGTIRNWEQRRRQPEGPARVLLTVIERYPEKVLQAIWPEKR